LAAPSGKIVFSVTQETSPRVRSVLPLASRVAGIATALVGTAVLAGWILDVRPLKSVLPNLATMKANTAIAFILAGLSLALLAPPRRGRWARHLAQGCALTATLIALLTLAEYATGRNLGIDQLLVADTPGGLRAPFPGRMGVNTALAFFLLGPALLGVDVETRGGRYPAQLLALAGGTVAAISLVGYLYSATALFGIASYTQMALHTAGTLLLLAAGILCARPDRGLMATVTSDAPGGLMARRLLPAALGVPLALGWLQLEGERAGLYGMELGLSLLVTAILAVFAILAWSSAASLNRADAARRESEARTAASLEGALDAVVTIDHQGRITEFNRAAERIFGYRRTEVLGREMAELLIPPALRDRHRQGLAGYLTTGHGPVIGQRLQLPALRADGTEFPVELTITRLPSDGPPMFTGFLRDVTLERQTQEALAKSTERLSILHEIDRAIIAARPPVEIAEAVLRRLRDLLGVPRAIVNLFDLATGEVEWLAAAGRRRMHLGPGVRFPLALMGDVEALRRGELQVIDVASLPPSADAEALLASGVHVYMVVPMIAGGELIGGLSFGGASATFPPEQVSIAQEAAAQLAIAIAQARLYERVKGQAEELEQRVRERTRELSAANEQLEQEVGERRRAEAEADRATRAKSEFLANMSHELRTPLNAIIGFTELIHDDKVGPASDEQKEFLGDILVSSRHLLQLINDVLDLAKVESGSLEFHPEPVDLARLTDEVRDVLRGLATRKQIRLETAVDPAIGSVILDPAKLKQVLYNYASNAIKFTPEGGRVALRAAPEGADAVRLEVEDTGIGIRPEDLGRLFVEFQQLDAGPAKRHEGTGLGLALTKRLVEAQGGRVGVRSIPGQGSVFYAVFPRATRPLGVAALPATPVRAAPRGTQTGPGSNGP
jgi:PAS domain S-box-containing protein